MENVLNSIYSNSIMVQDQSNDTAKEAAVEAVHARVVAKPNFIRGSVELLVLYLQPERLLRLRAVTAHGLTVRRRDKDSYRFSISYTVQID